MVVLGGVGIYREHSGINEGSGHIQRVFGAIFSIH